MTDKKKILIISDHPLAPSGVGSQTKYVIEALLKPIDTKLFVLVVQFAMRVMIHKVKAGMKIGLHHPVKGYGTQEMVRSALFNERPDMIWFMTDPRFYGWLWGMENEIRQNIPMVYYHVWDNYPYPKYNELSYRSTRCYCFYLESYS